MYKIPNSRIYCTTKPQNTYVSSKEPTPTHTIPPPSNVLTSRLLNQDIEKMHLLPPHCPLYPNGYNQFFNDNNTLNPVVPYKITEVKHPKDGKKIQRLEYNNFYSDWKQDSLKWYPTTATTEYDNANIDDSGRGDSGRGVPRMTEHNMELYEQTRRKEPFAKPLATNGTNQLNIIFNDKCAGTTFNYKRYASLGVNNTSWFNNPLYNEDISLETQTQKTTYMNNIVQNGMDLYSSVFEDMYLLGYEPQDGNDNINQNIDDEIINNIRKSY